MIDEEREKAPSFWLPMKYAKNLGGEQLARQTWLLAELDSELDQRLKERLVDRFLRGSGFHVDHRDWAKSEVAITVTSTSSTSGLELFIRAPRQAGCFKFEWDGSEELAERMVDSAADLGIEEMRWERENLGPLDWESD